MELHKYLLSTRFDSTRLDWIRYDIFLSFFETCYEFVTSLNAFCAFAHYPLLLNSTLSIFRHYMNFSTLQPSSRCFSQKFLSWNFSYVYINQYSIKCGSVCISLLKLIKPFHSQFHSLSISISNVLAWTTVKTGVSAGEM